MFNERIQLRVKADKIANRLKSRCKKYKIFQGFCNARQNMNKNKNRLFYVCWMSTRQNVLLERSSDSLCMILPISFSILFAFAANCNV